MKKEKSETGIYETIAHIEKVIRAGTHFFIAAFTEQVMFSIPVKCFPYNQNGDSAEEEIDDIC
jgi:hypothetical protein